MVQAELHNKDKIQMVTLKAKLLKPKLKTSKANIEQNLSIYALLEKRILLFLNVHVRY